MQKKAKVRYGFRLAHVHAHADYPAGGRGIREADCANGRGAPF
jgi:hypothetical protein